MIQEESMLTVADNTGALTCKCIRVFKGEAAHVGDFIKVTVRTARPDGNTKRKTVCTALIIRTVYQVHRPDGTSVSSSDNACVLVDDKGDPKGTRVFGPVFREVKNKGYQKVASLASEVI